MLFLTTWRLHFFFTSKPFYNYEDEEKDPYAAPVVKSLYM